MSSPLEVDTRPGGDGERLSSRRREIGERFVLTVLTCGDFKFRENRRETFPDFDELLEFGVVILELAVIISFAEPLDGEVSSSENEGIEEPDRRRTEGGFGVEDDVGGLTTVAPPRGLRAEVKEPLSETLRESLLPRRGKGFVDPEESRLLLRLSLESGFVVLAGGVDENLSALHPTPSLP